MKVFLSWTRISSRRYRHWIVMAIQLTFDELFQLIRHWCHLYAKSVFYPWPCRNWSVSPGWSMRFDVQYTIDNGTNWVMDIVVGNALCNPWYLIFVHWLWKIIIFRPWMSWDMPWWIMVSEYWTNNIIQLTTWKRSRIISFCHHLYCSVTMDDNMFLKSTMPPTEKNVIFGVYL